MWSRDVGFEWLHTYKRTWQTQVENAKRRKKVEGERLMTTGPPRVFRQVDEGWQVWRPSEHSSTSVQEVTCHVENRIFNFCRKFCNLREWVAIACEAFLASAVEPARPVRKQSVCDRAWI